MAEQLEEAVDLPTWAPELAPALGPPPAPAPAPPSEPPAEPSWDQPGGLDLKETRSWRTWHLVATAMGALLFGMAIGHANARPATGGPAKGGLFTLPASSGTATTATSVEPERSSTTPSTSEEATGTTLAPEAAVTGVPKVLFDKKAAGPLAAIPLGIKGGTWKIGWAYDCTRAGTADGSAPFQIVVAPASGAPAVAVDEAGRNKTGITPQTVSGPLTMEVRTACRWAVKVTGIPS